MLQKPEKDRDLLNYVPFSRPHEKSNWKQKIQHCFSGVAEELQSFWSFFWRWLLIFLPFWALLMGFYWCCSSGT